MIGLIGYGRFGRLTVANLSPDFQVVVYTRDTQKAADIAAAGGRLVPFAEACQQKILILCVPISAMQATLKEIRPHLAPDTLVVDVCSVKVFPVEWMKRLLPDATHILATHPMFGPDSAARSLVGHKIVLCPERIQPGKYLKIKAWLEKIGLLIIETTPVEHDRKIATSLALTHFIGRGLSELGVQGMDIDTEGYKRLLRILEVVSKDTWQLFEDMHRFNPFAVEQRDAFLNAMAKVSARLDQALAKTQASI